MPDHPIPPSHGSLPQCPSVPTVASVHFGSNLLCSPCASPGVALVLADGHAAPLLLLSSPGRTGKDKLIFTHGLLYSPASPMGMACIPQGMAHPVPALSCPGPQGEARCPGLGLPLVLPGCPAPDQGGGTAPATPRSPGCSWTPALAVSRCLPQASYHWLPSSTSLQCHCKLIFIPVPFVLPSTHLHNFLLYF